MNALRKYKICKNRCVKTLLTRGIDSAFEQVQESENAIQINVGCRFVGLQTVRLPIYDSGDGSYGRQTVYSERNRTNVTAWGTVCQISRMSQFVERKTGKLCLENDRPIAMAASVAQKSAHTGSRPWSRECDVQGHTGRGWSRG